MSVEQITASDAFALLSSDKNTALIDVRTDAEFTFVGTVDLREIDGNLILLPWKNFPAMDLNPNFTANLEKTLLEKFGEKRHEAKLIFMCLSGGRSQQAAMHIAQLGYEKCFNLVGGFEGAADHAGHRGKISGWKSSNLPWRQA